MSHLHRFYEPEMIPSQGTAIALSETEAHHALNVVRVKDGETVSLFDGRGVEVHGPVQRVGKRGASVTACEILRSDPPDAKVTIAPAWLHRDKPLEEIVRRCTELGVAGFAFWRSEHSQRQLPAGDKVLRWAIDSCKQCGRNHLPVFSFHDHLDELLGSASPPILYADMEKPPAPIICQYPACTLLIGPEGDFSSGERESLIEIGALPFNLGANILRTEIAAITAAILVLNSFGQLGTRFSLP